MQEQASCDKLLLIGFIVVVNVSGRLLKHLRVFNKRVVGVFLGLR